MILTVGSMDVKLAYEKSIDYGCENKMVTMM
jgi:hypothetical protein